MVLSVSDLFLNLRVLLVLALAVDWTLLLSAHVLVCFLHPEMPLLRRFGLAAAGLSCIDFSCLPIFEESKVFVFLINPLMDCSFLLQDVFSCVALLLFHCLLLDFFLPLFFLHFFLVSITFFS